MNTEKSLCPSCKGLGKYEDHLADHGWSDCYCIWDYEDEELEWDEEVNWDY